MMTDRSTADQAKTAAKDVADDAKREADRLTDEAKSEFKGLMDEASTKAREQADAQTHRAASSLSNYSEQLREMSRKASDDNQAARFVEGAADQLDSVASTIEDKGWNGLMDDVSRFARRNPTGFLAAAFGVGFAASRVIRNADTDRIMQESESEEQSGSAKSRSDDRSGSGSEDRSGFQADARSGSELLSGDRGRAGTPVGSRAGTPVESSSQQGYGGTRPGREETKEQDPSRYGSSR